MNAKPPQHWTHRLRLLLAAAILPLGACSAVRGPDPRLAERLEPIVTRLDSTGATAHVRVIELPSGRELYARAATEPVVPASNMKLFSSAAALDLLGADHVFRTYLAFDGRDLWIIGTGDPGLGDPRIEKAKGRTVMSVLDDWAAALAARGIREIPGDLVYYDQAFELKQIHPRWEDDDALYWYGAPVGGLNFNDNCIDVTVYPAEPGAPARYEILPPISSVTIVNQCITGEAKPPTIEKMPHADVFVLGGGCTKRTTLRSKPVTDPGAFLAEALRHRLAAAGIAIAGDSRGAGEPLGGTIPPPAEMTIAVHETAMPDVLRRVNTNSQNMFAEALFKAAGAADAAKAGRREPGSWDNGRRAVEAFLDRRRIDRRGMEIVDGSGLSRHNRVTALAVTQLLHRMWHHEDGEVYRLSLDTPDDDGSLGKRLRGLENRVFAKTGYVGGTRALSGYVHTDSGKCLAFSIIYNRIPGRVGPYEALQDEAVRTLATWPALTSLENEEVASR
jgi:D-alanyl-D-alanine carboxypeptidase/D-alanyl-D-alanine-endopeptidase (penicillin-binding protein 4)